MEASGYGVRQAKTVKDAFRFLEEERPGLVLCDIMLPDNHGFKVCEKVKTTPGLENVRVIMVTAKSSLADRRLAKRVGADGYLVKPFNPKDLLGMVKDFYPPSTP
ncbi:MAG: response regulator [Myxococcales bacterium]|nr:response regulator [Myxococcales bacterium]